MEGNRRYADEPDPRWYGGSAFERPAADEADEPYRVPEQRWSDSSRLPGETGTGRLRAEPGTGAFDGGSGGFDSGSGGFGADPKPGGFDSAAGGFGGDAKPGSFGADSGGFGDEQVRAAHEPMRFPLRSEGTRHTADPVVPAPLVPPLPPGALPTEPPPAPRGAQAAPRSAPAVPRSAPPGPRGPAPVSAPAVGPVSGGGTTYGGGGIPAAEPTGVLPPVPVARPDDAVYASRRPAVGIGMIVLVVLLAVPAVRLFLSAAFGGEPVAREIVPASLLLLGLPLTGMGLWALANGGRVGGQGAWLRPPVGYLTVGLALLAAAALAVG
ncbi:hypothetical protein [Spirilliplanes yamanashiensis]|uniref:Uncharacterized protein n=1 Tax=Spirilliplanes yamanashiensis TaxID=42233 RepID=A0A8J3Y510_9ACTN|nr:hypothetical protein [Spirilliplanes yamanashiensis]MDP9819687.1 hypothetical protein [Spirilliplanes yamanashiensis]GIJ01493.1 hypothetical protein Sya03_08450 [Spirilliplanes yamanashiensis]